MGYIIAAIVAAAGAYAQYRAQKNSIEAQQNTLSTAQALAEQQDKKSESTLVANAKTMDPGQRLQAYNDTAAATDKALTQALANANATSTVATTPATGNTGRTSSAFSLYKDTSDQAQNQAITAQAARMANAGAFGVLGQNEALSRAQAALTAGLYSQNARDTMSAAQRAASVIAPNPWQTLLGQAGVAAGTAYLGA